MRKFRIFIVVWLILLVAGVSNQQALGYGGAPEQNSAYKYTVEINSDKKSYNVGESIVFSGSVSKYNQDRILQITIFNSENSLVLLQKNPVNADGTFSYEVIPNEKFLEGEYTIRAQYGKSNITVEKFSFAINSSEYTAEAQQLENVKIPEWVRNNAGWWSSGQIDDDSFVQGIQFMINEGFMIIPITEQGSVSQDSVIPSWLKNNAGWWSSGQIDDDSFVQGIQFMINEGFMRITG